MWRVEMTLVDQDWWFRSSYMLRMTNFTRSLPGSVGAVRKYCPEKGFSLNNGLVAGIFSSNKQQKRWMRIWLMRDKWDIRWAQTCASVTFSFPPFQLNSETTFPCASSRIRLTTYSFEVAPKTAIYFSSGTKDWRMALSLLSKFASCALTAPAAVGAKSSVITAVDWRTYRHSRSMVSVRMGQGLLELLGLSVLRISFYAVPFWRMNTTPSRWLIPKHLLELINFCHQRIKKNLRKPLHCYGTTDNEKHTLRKLSEYRSIKSSIPNLA